LRRRLLQVVRSITNDFVGRRTWRSTRLFSRAINSDRMPYTPRVQLAVGSGRSRCLWTAALTSLQAQVAHFRFSPDSRHIAASHRLASNRLTTDEARGTASRSCCAARTTRRQTAPRRRSRGCVCRCPPGHACARRAPLPAALGDRGATTMRASS
jgi:hypothetical protein